MDTAGYQPFLARYRNVMHQRLATVSDMYAWLEAAHLVSEIDGYWRVRNMAGRRQALSDLVSALDAVINANHPNDGALNVEVSAGMATEDLLICAKRELEHALDAEDSAVRQHVASNEHANNVAYWAGAVYELSNATRLFWSLQ